MELHQKRLSRYSRILFCLFFWYFYLHFLLHIITSISHVYIIWFDLATFSKRRTLLFSFRAGTCVVFGYSHYRTFDKRWYTFDGSCKYVLAKDVSTNLFDIVVDNTACNPSHGEKCVKNVGLHLNNSHIMMYEGRKVLIDNMLVMLPYNGPGITVKHVGHAG